SQKLIEPGNQRAVAEFRQPRGRLAAHVGTWIIERLPEACARLRSILPALVDAERGPVPHIFVHVVHQAKQRFPHRLLILAIFCYLPSPLAKAAKGVSHSK